MDDLIMLPWWVSATLAVVTFVVLTPIAVGLGGPAGLLLGLVFPGVFVLGAIGSIIHRRRRSALVEKQNSLDSLKDLSWKEFEWMVGEAYRRQGYSVEESLGGGPDGGVDLTLRNNGRKIIVQCKRWKKLSVGAPIVREQFGILTASNADEVIVVSSGKFTKEAVKFAEGKPITLVDGEQLLRLLAGVQKNRAAAANAWSESESTPDCPKCGESMVIRTAKRGKNVGEQFWGCSKFPKCRSTIAIRNQF